MENQVVVAKIQAATALALGVLETEDWVVTDGTVEDYAEAIAQLFNLVYQKILPQEPQE